MLRKIVVTLFILTASITFFGCTKKTTTSQTTPEIAALSGDSSSAEKTIQENLVKAKTAAIAWNNSAQFYALVLKVTPETPAGNLTETFVFGAPSDANNWWTFSISEKTGKIVRSLTPKEDFMGTDFQPVKEENWKISYLDALKLAENSGGVGFRAKNPNAAINLSLAQNSPKNWLWWKVDYSGENEDLKVLINALDGNISNDEGNPLSEQTPTPEASVSAEGSVE